MNCSGLFAVRLLLTGEEARQKPKCKTLQVSLTVTVVYLIRLYVEAVTKQSMYYMYQMDIDFSILGYVYFVAFSAFFLSLYSYLYGRYVGFFIRLVWVR